MPKFSSCRGLSFTLWRKCGSTTLYAIFGLYGSVFGHFLGVRGVTKCHIFAQICPWEWKRLGEKKIYMYIKNDHVHVNFVNLIFRNFFWNDDIKNFFCIVWTSWMGWAELNGVGRVEWDWHMGMSYLTSLKHFLFNFFTCILQLKSIANSRGLRTPI